MSYCVNCGVELNSNERRCPLCSTPVINPNIDDKKSELPPYPSESELLVERKIKRTTAFLISIILLVPMIICPLCDHLVTGNISWSLYAILGIGLGWVLIVPPMMMHHDTALKSAWVDFFALLIFFYLINKITTPQINWFERLSLPITCFIIFAFTFVAILIKYTNVKPLTIIALIIFLVGVFVTEAEILINLFIGREALLYWSLPSIIACTALSFIFLIISRLANLKAAIKKRMHI